MSRTNMIDDDIQISRLGQALKQGLGYILLVGILIGAITYAATVYFLPKQYAASTTLILSRSLAHDPDSTIEVNDVLLNQELIGTYGELVKSRAVLQQALTKGRLPYRYDEFKKMVSVDVVNDTEIISITVTTTEPRDSSIGANAIADAFKSEVQRTMNIDNVKVVDKAIPLQDPVGPPKLKYSLVAAFIAMLCTAFIITLRSVMDNQVRDSEELKHTIDLPVLAVIPKGKGR